eukprot:12419335-Alexandrium_andersonii.AAC.1
MISSLTLFAQMSARFFSPGCLKSSKIAGSDTRLGPELPDREVACSTIACPTAQPNGSDAVRADRQ